MLEAELEVLVQVELVVEPLNAVQDGGFLLRPVTVVVKTPAAVHDSQRLPVS